MVANTFGIAAGETKIDPDVAPFDPTRRLKSGAKGRDASLCFGVILVEAQQEAGASHTFLCNGSKRPRGGHAAEYRDEFAPSHVRLRETRLAEYASLPPYNRAAGGKWRAGSSRRVVGFVSSAKFRYRKRAP